MHARQTNARHDRGFTLLEMGIVIVVIGLITGGILVGQNLIRSAEVQSVIGDFIKYQAATARFQAQFASLPGDMPDATSHWGGQAHNGDGDGFIDDLSQVGSVYSEPMQFWKHLQLAKELDISVSGQQQACANCVSLTADEDTPGSKLHGSMWIPGYDAVNAIGATSVPPVAASNFMLFTGEFEYAPPGPLLTPAEAFNIDRKIDNGIGATGEVVGASLTSCLLGNEYNVTDETRQCALVFLNAF